MTVVPAQQSGGGGGSSGLYDVLELVLDRGLVIDAFVRVSLVGIEILKIDVRVVVASVDTYLRFAEACNRLDLESGPKKSPGLPEIVGEVTESGARGKSKGASPAPPRPSRTPSSRAARARPSRARGPVRPPRGARRSRSEHVRLRHHRRLASLPARGHGRRRRPGAPAAGADPGELAAVVSDAPEGLRPKRRELLAHQNVLSEIGAGGCVLPMRFGSVAPDDDTVTSVLAERADHYLERLRALDGRVEYNVKANHVEDAVLHHVMALNPEIRALAESNRQSGGGSYDDKIRLGEMVAEAVKAREAEDGAALENALRGIADAESVGPESTGWLANVSYLVKRSTAEDFLAAVEKARADMPHLEIRLNGPLPPYSFVEPGPAEPAGTTVAADTGAE